MIHAESEIERDLVLKSVSECIEFATSSSSQRVTPLPSPIDGSGRSPLSSTTSMRHASPMPPHSPEVPNLGVHMSKLQLEPGQTAHGNQPPSAMPQPQTAPLPPRKTSLRQSNTSNAPPLSPTMGQQRGMPFSSISPGMPTSPIMHQQGTPAPMSSVSEPGMHNNSWLPRNVSTRSTHSNQSSHSTFSQQSAPHYGNQAAYQQMMRQPMPQMARQAFGPGPLRTDLPPVPQVQSAYPSERQSFPNHPITDRRPSPGIPPPQRARSAEPFSELDELRLPDKPSARFGALRSESPAPGLGVRDDDSPPPSPTAEEPPTIRGPTTVTAQMKCKVFLQQGHQQWKSLGHGKLKLYVEKGRNIKQLVVESDKSSTLISTIILTDGVERVGRTGVAVEVSGKGEHTGVIYMIQLRNESSASGFYESLLAGSDRAR